MSPAPPADHDARRRVVTDTASTLFVEAGAGTGKTASLVGRIVSLVAVAGVELRSVAAITFTVAAAAELRDRVRTAFEDLAGGDAVLPDGSPGADVHRQRAAQALHQIDEAAITTLHGFAQRILAEFPIEAGLPPAVEVVDEVAAEIEFDRRWTGFLDELFGDDTAAEPLAEAVALGLRTRQLREIAQSFHQNWDHLRDADLPTPSLPGPDLAPLRAALQDVLRLRDGCRDDDDLLARHIDETVAPVHGALDELGDTVEALELLAASPALRCRNGRAAEWDDVDAARAACAQADRERADVLRHRRSLVLATLLPRLQAFTVGGARRRAAEGRLEYHDLLVLARDVLVASPDVRRRLARRYQHILVDEFQDTDPLQVEIAVLLAADDPGAPVGSWRDVQVGDGRLFVVGDPKQSIYRFRRADIAVYEEARRRAGATDVHLEVNFRSRPGVLAWVNHVFGALIGAGDPGSQPPYRHLLAHRSGEEPAVRLVGGPLRQRVDDVRRQEAQALAGLIASVKADGWQVHDRVTGELRPARYDDIAVLVPARTTLPELEQALGAAGIPFRMESRSLLFRTEEVRTVLALLQAVDDPSDEVAVIAALRSPALACRDDELVAYRLAGGRWDHTAPVPDDVAADDPVRVALGRLRALHDLRWWTSVAGMVDHVIRDLRLVELTTAAGRPRDGWRRIRYVGDQARLFTEAGGRTLREFTRWAQDQADADAAVVETPVPEPDDDAVRILTIHGAKGLEFPVTILSGLNSEPPPRGPVVLWRPAEQRVEVSVGASAHAFATPGFDDLAGEERRLDAHERVRLLYVAATRARDHLVVSMFHKVNGGGSSDAPAALLLEAAETAPDTWQAWEPGETGGADAPPPVGARADEGTLPDRGAWAAEREALLAAAVRPSALAASGLADLVGAASPERTGGGGGGGAAVGRAVHATLQAVDLTTGDDLDALAAARAAAEGVPQHAGRVAGLARTALASPAVRAAAASGRHWREVFVAAPVAGATVEGFVDLLYDDGEGLVVVDYKTDAVVGDGELDAAVAHHRLQAAAYAAVLGASLGRPVRRCVFVFLTDGGAVERQLPDLEAAITEVEATVIAAAG